jgi:hypothetical protein
MVKTKKLHALLHKCIGREKWKDLFYFLQSFLKVRDRIIIDLNKIYKSITLQFGIIILLFIFNCCKVSEISQLPSTPTAKQKLLRY